MFGAPDIPLPAHILVDDWELLSNDQAPILTCAQAVVRIVEHQQRQQLVAKAVGRTKLRAAANVSTTTTTGRSTIPDGYDYVEPTLAQRAHFVLTKSRTNYKELWIYLPTDPVVELLQCYLVELLLRQLGALDIMSTCIRRFCARSPRASSFQLHRSATKLCRKAARVGCLQMINYQGIMCTI